MGSYISQEDFNDIGQSLSKQKFKIYVFTDQHSLKRKIRVEVQ